MYKCPYCKHTLETKNLRQGLYGRCSYCRFAGYIPKIGLEEVKTETEEVKTGLDKISDEEKREIKEWLNKIRKKHKIKGSIPDKIVLEELKKEAKKSNRTLRKDLTSI